MGCNRKVKLLVTELFRGWKGVSKNVTISMVPVEPSFTKSRVVAKQIYLSEKDICLIFVG